MEGLIFGGAYLRREICVSKSNGLALYLEVNLPFLLCFTLYLRAIFQVQVPRGLIFGGAIYRRVLCVTGLGGLYLEGLIHGGAYFRNFSGNLLINQNSSPVLIGSKPRLILHNQLALTIQLFCGRLSEKNVHAKKKAKDYSKCILELI